MVIGHPEQCVFKNINAFLPIYKLTDNDSANTYTHMHAQMYVHLQEYLFVCVHYRPRYRHEKHLLLLIHLNKLVFIVFYFCSLKNQKRANCYVNFK